MLKMYKMTTYSKIYKVSKDAQYYKDGKYV